MMTLRDTGSVGAATRGLSLVVVDGVPVSESAKNDALGQELDNPDLEHGLTEEDLDFLYRQEPDFAKAAKRVPLTGSRTDKKYFWLRWGMYLVLDRKTERIHFNRLGREVLGGWLAKWGMGLPDSCDLGEFESLMAQYDFHLQEEERGRLELKYWQCEHPKVRELIVDTLRYTPPEPENLEDIEPIELDFDPDAPGSGMALLTFIFGQED